RSSPSRSRSSTLVVVAMSASFPFRRKKRDRRRRSWRFYGNRMRLPAPDRPLADGVVALRAWEPGDAPAIVAAIDGDPEIATWLDAVPQPYRLVDAHDFVAQCRRSWADGIGAAFAILDAEGTVVGSIGARFGDPAQ